MVVQSNNNHNDNGNNNNGNDKPIGFNVETFTATNALIEGIIRGAVRVFGPALVVVMLLRLFQRSPEDPIFDESSTVAMGASILIHLLSNHPDNLKVLVLDPKQMLDFEDFMMGKEDAIHAPTGPVANFYMVGTVDPKYNIDLRTLVNSWRQEAKANNPGPN